MKVLSWNVQGEIGISDERLEEQCDFLEEHTSDIDLFLLQAVNFEQGIPDGWAGHLGGLIDYLAQRGFHITHTGDWAQAFAESSVQPHAGIKGSHNRCNLTASRWPIERRPLDLRNKDSGNPQNLNYYYSHFPEKILVSQIDLSGEEQSDVDSVEVWNVGIINGANWGEEKLNMLETVYARIYLQTQNQGTPILLGGDFNAPKREAADGSIIPHGQNKGQYTNYPYYGDPHYLREQADNIEERRFDRRWQLAEKRIFDQEVGEWGLEDTYWAAEESRQAASTEDYTHIVHTASPPEKRLDHVLVSEEFEVSRCEIWNGQGSVADALGPSDHAAVVAEMTV